MNFKRHISGERELRAQGIDLVRLWYATSPEAQFQIVLDMRFDAYSATFKRYDELGHPAHFIGSVYHHEMKLPFFNTFDAAKRACEYQLKSMRK